ncbi:patatin-like phospholipase family protein [Aurantiacibacter rhizosphaerae]|uniref:Patatin-like phospholipase family protein n=1 Tax=Aurantiacibacter rhizosphaerae TaxID=2691582 RepID=A0A844XFZ7_9SPHN|nr:patatin-like phospholipase family protein [Aurantiacibacter rhizosphaerae]MWV28514.1 patatin-like phospholipase family protein [Aurantiacibacter rhizosphaerae]
MASQYQQVVFSGGGIRCFWHGGFLSEVGGFEDLRPERISTVSGGALSAATWIGGREDDLLAVMHEAFLQNDSNFAAGKSNYTPHQEIYRDVVDVTMDREAIERVAAGPEYEVALSVPPEQVAPHLSAILYGVLYKLDQAVRSTPHLRIPRHAGLRELRVDARQAAREGHLVDLICAAATIPPVFDVPEWQDCRVLDGGMLDKAPLPTDSEGETLVLLTSRYRNCPDLPGRTYAQPSKEVAADKIDFTDASKVTRTWDQGVRDGKAWLAKNGRAD